MDKLYTIKGQQPEPYKKKYINIALRQYRDEINRLRITEFNRSDDFLLLNPDKLLWSVNDEGNAILAAWDGDRHAVATMRAVTIKNIQEAQKCLECFVPEEIVYPAVVFNSAATHKHHRCLGLNQAIRYYFLKAALRADIQTFISPVYLGASRTRFMEQLGYRFMEPGKTWQTKLQPHSPRLLAILERGKIRHALTLIEEKRGEILHQYPWQGEPFEF
jgi:hypothetical protein